MESSSEAFFEGRRDHMNARLEWGVQASTDVVSTILIKHNLHMARSFIRRLFLPMWTGG